MTCYQNVTIVLLMQKNIQKLMIEFFQYLCGLSVLIKKEVFEKSSLNITFAIVK